MALKMTLKYHYVTALIILPEFRLQELSLQLYQNANDSCWCCIKMKCDSLRKFSFRDFTEYYFTSRLNKTPESRLKVRSQFFFFNLLFYVRSMCCLVYLLSKHLSAQTLPNVRTQFRRVFMKVRFKRWHVNRGSLCHITLYKAIL